MRYLSLLVLAGLIGCTTDKRAEIIANHEQAVGNTKIDLQLDVKSIEDLGVVKASDSLKIYQEAFDKNMAHSLEFEREQLAEYQKERAERKAQIDKETYTPIRESDLILLKSDDSTIARQQKLLAKYEAGGAGTSLEPLIKKIDHFKRQSDKVIANKVKCTYTIVNPLLNNAKQEVTNVYYFTPDNSRIIRKEAVNLNS